MLAAALAALSWKLTERSPSLLTRLTIMVPVLATFATVLPDNMPMKALPKIEMRAGLDLDFPASAVPIEMMNFVPPVAFSIPT